MNGLDSHARAILDAARHADDPTQRQRERTARAMALRFGFGTAALTTSASVWAALATAKVWVPAVLVVASGAGGAVWFESKRPAPIAAQVAAAHAPATDAPAPAVDNPPTVADNAAPAPVKEETAETNDGPTAQRPSKTAHPKETTGATTSHLQEETALLAEVNGALGAGQLRGALDLLDTYDRRYPNGVLREESAATRVIVLCQLERGPRAAAMAKRFLVQHASSPLVPRVQRACSGQIP
jgi:hypothetical protein